MDGNFSERGYMFRSISECELSILLFINITYQKPCSTHYMLWSEFKHELCILVLNKNRVNIFGQCLGQNLNASMFP